MRSISQPPMIRPAITARPKPDVIPAIVARSKRNVRRIFSMFGVGEVSAKAISTKATAMIQNLRSRSASR